MISIGERIEQLRDEFNLKQELLAKKIGVSQETISSWSKGRTLPKADAIIKMTKLFKVSADYLLGITNERC